MWSEGKDQIYMLVTSDGGTYKENKTSSFKIDLQNPIDVGDENWEVALLSMTYPRTWVTIGRAAGVYMSYYLDPVSGEQAVMFPDWQCLSLKELEGFITKEIADNEGVEASKVPLQMMVDDLGRVLFHTNNLYYDVGFSDNMLRVLGFQGHPRVEDMRLDAFDKRQEYRNLIDQFCTKQNFDYNNIVLTNSIKTCAKLEWFELSVEKFLPNDFREHFDPLYEKMDLEDDVKEAVEELVANEKQIIEGPKQSLKACRALALLMVYMKRLFNIPMVPMIIVGTSIGIMDPVQRMFVYCNLLDHIHMNNTKSKILKVVSTKGEAFKMTQEDFTNPIYLPVQKGRHNMIQMYIKNDQGENVPFESGTVLMLLHFRKRSK